ncbi:MAG TPA: DUF3945 domain-containing protein, partial [Fibrella sp.]
MEPTPAAESSVGPDPIDRSLSGTAHQQEFERLETQQYQLVLPAKYEQVRGYLENDGLLSDEEITRCLYDETIRRADLAKRIEERTPTVPENDRNRLTDYLWEVHQTVKGLPLSFLDPKETYRIEVVDTPTRPAEAPNRYQLVSEPSPSSRRGQVNPVTLHLDINGGFLANFLHNAQLNHEQMNQFITDLERQHRELKAQLNAIELPRLIQEVGPAAAKRPNESAQLPEESGPSLSSWQRLRQTVSDWIAPTAPKETHTPEPYEIARQPKLAPESPQVEQRRAVAQPSPSIQADTAKPPLGPLAQEPARQYVAQAATTSLESRPQTDGATLTVGVSHQSTSQSLATNQTQVRTMNETSTPGVEVPVTGRQTRYQWAEVAAQFDKVGITRQDLEKAGHLDDLLNGRKTGLMKLTQTGEEGKPFQISGKLYIVNTPDKGPLVGIQPERKQLLLPKEFLGYALSARDTQNLEKTGEMGKRVELTDKMTRKTFKGYVGVDKETKSLTVLRAERLHIPQTIKGVTLTKQQQKNLEQGRAIKLEGMTSNNGQTFNAYVQVSAAKRSLTFAKIPDNAVKQTVDQKTAQDLTKPV